MAKGSDSKPDRYTVWARGPGTKKKATGGKGGDPARTVYDPNYSPTVASAGDFDYKGDTSEGAKKFVAGANILDEKGKATKRKSFKEHIKSGGRAADPRNWEFHYKGAGGGKRYTSSKGQTASEKRMQGKRSARMGAEKKARLTGKGIYEVQEIEYNTQGIIQDADAALAKSKALGGAGAFGSTRVATSVAAQKQKSNRRSGPGRGQATTGAFDTPSQKKRIA